MKNKEITDPIFLQAVEAIDVGDIDALKKQIEDHPRLVTDKLDYKVDGYFNQPYLLWFIADNPIRVEKSPGNIVSITGLLIDFIRKEAPDTLQEQLDYTLGLVVTGRTTRDCGVQLPLIDLLINEGAVPGDGVGALAHGNVEAARRLLERSGQLTLPVAVGLSMTEDIKRLLPEASHDQQLTALTMAAFYGNTEMISFLLEKGIDPNGYPSDKSGFHSHATPLHQAVSSGSLEAVRLLVEAGADLQAKDKVYSGTAPGWAHHMATGEGQTETSIKNYMDIAEYLGQKV